MKVHKFAPVVVFDTEIKGYASLLKDLHQGHSFDDETGLITGELNGKVLVHKDPAFASFFKEVKSKVVDYLNVFNFQHELYDLNIVKSWYTVCGTRFNVPKHYHSCSHISFVYYIDVREDDPLIFYIDNMNEWFGDAFYFVNERQDLNGLNYAVQPKNETLLIFPGKLKHYTAAQRNYKRMSIAGDVLLTLKEDMLDFESGLLPTKYWS
jgi:uncharacterized protein (TIGR02466 family)